MERYYLAKRTDREEQIKTHRGTVGISRPPHCEVGKMKRTISVHNKKLISGLRDLATSEVSSLQEAKKRISDAILDVFPNISYAAVVDLLPGANGEVVKKSLDMEHPIISTRVGGTGPADTTQGFHIPVIAYTDGSLRPFTTEIAVVETPGIEPGSRESCVSIPLRGRSEINAFLCFCATSRSGRTFGSRDEPLLWLLADIASLLMSRAADIEMHDRLRAVAEAGQPFCNLAHDARTTLETLELEMVALEEDIPGLIKDASWQGFRENLGTLQQMIVYAFRRVCGAQDTLPRAKVQLRKIVDEVINECRRWYSNPVRANDVTVVNECPQSASALINPENLRWALTNCIQNSIGALKEAWSKGETRSGAIKVILSNDFVNSNEDYCLLSVYDEAGGIPPSVLRQLGEPCIRAEDRNGQGMGMGVSIICDVVSRMGGQVYIATSTDQVGDFGPGTVVTIWLPKTDKGDGNATKAAPPILIPYAEHCAQMERSRFQGD